MRKKLIIPSVVFLFLFFLIVPKISASPENSPVFATIQFVQNKFDQLTQTTQQNTSDIDLVNQRLDQLEQENQDLKDKIDELENNQLPTGKWVHVCFDVATANLSVMKNGTCFPHVHWKIFVQCYPGTPCVPDNPADTYYVPPQEQ